MKARNHRSTVFAWVVGAIVAGVLLVYAPFASAFFQPGPATSDPNFELDVPSADAMDAPSDGTMYLGDDWETVYACYEDGDGHNPAACAALGFLNANLISTTGIMHDHPPTTIFRKGGSKDIHDVTRWEWKSGGVPDKDEISHAYAAAYNVGGELVVYIGADRYSNDGDAMMGAWFFQDVVEPVEETPGAGKGDFIGRHKNGDILWIGHFSGGGVIAEMKVLKWNSQLVSPGDPAPDPACLNNDGNLPEQVKGTNLCLIADGPTNPGYFASVNTGWEESPWDYHPKQPEPGYEEDWFPYNSFMEGGINITQMLGGATPCFSTFLIESRSSTEYNAVLKDFVQGRIDTCRIQVAKTCQSQLGVDGASIDNHFVITVTNTGNANLDYIELTDLHHTPTSWTHSPAPAPGHSAVVADYWVNVTQQNLYNEVTAIGRTTGGYATSPATDDVTCPAVPVNPGLVVTKDCDEIELVPENDKLVVKVSYDGTVCNTGDVRLRNVSATDTREGQEYPVTLSHTTLNPGNCATFSGSYFPSQRVGSGVTVRWNSSTECFEQVDRQHWSDLVDAEGTEVIESTPVYAVADPADCPLCPECPD